MGTTKKKVAATTVSKSNAQSAAVKAKKNNAKPPISKRLPITAGTAAKYNDTLDAGQLLHVLTEMRNGNFGARMPIDQVGLNGKICDTLNDIILLNEKMMMEFTRAGNTIGKQGKLTQRIEVPSARGSWRTGVESLNNLISDLVHPTIEIAHVISSVAKGNLSTEMSMVIGDHSLQGEFARIAKEVASGYSTPVDVGGAVPAYFLRLAHHASARSCAVRTRVSSAMQPP